jgi:DNA modification methylase
MKLINDDCLNAFLQIPQNSVDLTVTSPPYDNLRDYNNNTIWDESVWREVIRHLWLRTKPGGVVVWIVNDATINGSETGTSFRQALYAMGCGFNLHDTMIWKKPSFSAVGSLQTRYAPVFEYMFIWSKGKPKTFNPIKDRPNKSVSKKNNYTSIRLPDGSIRVNKPFEIKPFGQRFNVWEQSTVSQKGNKCHPAPFPITLAEDHIKSWSNPSDIVLDPFMGSGTTGVACKNLGRDFIGIEIDKEYFNMAESRINENNT